MEPLPEVYKPGADVFWLKMEPQPTHSEEFGWCYGVGDRALSKFKDINKFKEALVRSHSPYVVGDTLYLREEWRYTSHGSEWDSLWFIEFRDGTKVNILRDNGKADFLGSVAWHERQPADTMPEWAADKRRRFTVTGVEAKRLQDIDGIEIDKAMVFEEGGVPERSPSMIVTEERYIRNDWGWCVTLKEID